MRPKWHNTESAVEASGEEDDVGHRVQIVAAVDAWYFPGVQSSQADAPAIIGAVGSVPDMLDSRRGRRPGTPSGRRRTRCTWWVHVCARAHARMRQRKRAYQMQALRRLSIDSHYASTQRLLLVPLVAL